jgi:hypothetical protein
MLVFFDREQIISKRQSFLRAKKKEIPIDGFEFEVVLNETKTQVDKIFYDRYYYKYIEIGIRKL